MGTISSSIMLYDGMSGVLRNINNALDLTISSFQSMQSACNRSFNTTELEAARQALAQANAQLENMGGHIRSNESDQEEFNTRIQNGTSETENLSNGFNKVGSKIKGMISAYLTFQSMKKSIDLSDTMAQNSARLGLMNDGLQTTKQLQDQIYNSAQRSRSNYLDMTNVISRLGLLAGKAFSSSSEIVKFSEIMQKNFVVGGASSIEQASAMYQLTQSMASGRLQGDEYRSIIENAPLLAKSIEDYMKNVQHAKGTMKDWAAAGSLTSDVIKNAVFRSADDVNAKFAKMPKTFSQIWTQFKNYAINAFTPVLNKLNQFANSKMFDGMVKGFVSAAVSMSTLAIKLFNLISQVTQRLSGSLSWVGPLFNDIISYMAGSIYTFSGLLANAFYVIGSIANFVRDNWSVIAPIITGFIIALGIYKTYTLVLGAVTKAQAILNAVMNMNPVMLIILGFIALITIFYTVIALINKLTGQSISATGVIAGSIYWVGALFKNTGLWIADVWLGLSELIKGLLNNRAVFFTNLIANMKAEFWSFVQFLTKGVIQIAELCNKVLGIFKINIDTSGLESSLVDFRNAEEKARSSKLNYEDLGKAWNKGFGTYKTFQKGWSSDAYSNGYNAGTRLQNHVTDYFGNLNNGFNTNPNSINLNGDPDSKRLANIDNNTGDIKDSVTKSDDELKYLREIAERQAINKYTTAAITVDMSGMVNKVENTTDLDNLVGALEGKLTNAIIASAEGVHA